MNTTTRVYTIQRTSPVWEGYGYDTKWHVLCDGLIVKYFWTKREATEWVKAVAA